MENLYNRRRIPHPSCFHKEAVPQITESQAFFHRMLKVHNIKGDDLLRLGELFIQEWVLTAEDKTDEDGRLEQAKIADSLIDISNVILHRELRKDNLVEIE